MALGGVAPVPYRAAQVEDYLRGQAAGSVDPAHAGYKVTLAKNLVKRAITQLLGTF